MDRNFNSIPIETKKEEHPPVNLDKVIIEALRPRKNWAYKQASSENTDPLDITPEKIDIGQSELRELTKAKYHEDLRENPGQIIRGLALMADVYSTGKNTLSNHDGILENFDENIKQELEISHKNAKVLFLEAGKILFPELGKNNDSKNLAVAIKDISEQLKSFSTIHIKHIAHLLDWAQENNLPEENIARELRQSMEVIAGELYHKTLQDENSEKILQQEGVATIKIIYRLDLLINNIENRQKNEEGGLYNKEDIEHKKTEAAQMKFINPRIPPEARPELSYQDRQKAFDEIVLAKTVEEVGKILTPEHKKAVLQQILLDLDDRIRSAKKERLSGEGNEVYGCHTLVLTSGWTISQVCQRIIAARDHKVASNEQIQKMNPADFLLKYLDYNLKEDKIRYKDLLEYTNIFD